MTGALQIRLKRHIKANFPDGDTNKICSFLTAILDNTMEGRVYKRKVLACYSRTKQEEIDLDFLVACEDLLLEYRGKTQMSLFGRGGGAA